MKITIIGGGAAGMMAAATIVDKSKDHKIHIIEKNSSLGRKVLLSGGGRCNLTTAIQDVKEVLKNYPRGNKWLRFSMHEFGPKQCFEWFEDHGVPLQAEKDKVFPKSNKGNDVIMLFQKIFKDHNIKISYNKSVKSIKNSKKGFQIELEDKSVVETDKVILATGGNAYQQTGSTGDGYSLAKQLGHKITPLAPSLNSFTTEDQFIKNLAGVSFENVDMSLIGKQTHQFSGSLLFTHKGVSGPGIFALSALAAYQKCDKAHPLTLQIDLIPDLNQIQLKEIFIKAIQKNPKVKISKTFRKFLPKSICSLILEKLSIPETQNLSELSKKNQNLLIDNIKNFPIILTGKTPGSEMVTAGGIDLKEVDPQTMESKIQPGLFFAGEILDIDGFTGGFNLQNAWATAKIAGEALTAN